MGLPPRDFKSRASTSFAIPANDTPTTNTNGNGSAPSPPFVQPRAGNGTRTRDPNLGKVVLYQLSYSRVPLEF